MYAILFSRYIYTLLFSDVADEEAIVNYYGPATAAGNTFQTSTAFAPYSSGLKKTEKVYILQYLGIV